MDKFIQKCYKLAVKISSHSEKENYKQTQSQGYLFVANTLVI